MPRAPRFIDRAQTPRRRLLIETILIFEVLVGLVWGIHFALGVALGVDRTQLVVLAVIEMALAVVVAFGLARLATPLFEWLNRRPGSNAPQNIQERLLSQPKWSAAAFALLTVPISIAASVLIGFGGSENDPILFTSSLALSLVAALALGSIIWTRVEDIWRPYVPMFFGAGDDPTQSLAARSLKLRSRLIATYVLATVVPVTVVATTAGALTLDRVPIVSFTISLTVRSVLMLILGVAAFGGLGRWILRPVRTVGDAMRRAETGELGTEVLVERADELGNLERGFNQMMAGLRREERLAALYEKQVGAEVAAYALEHGDALVAQEREISVLFIDLVKFTTLTENSSPQELFSVLNHYFGVVADSVSTHSGLLNKFEGDAALALFGAPDPNASHAENAIRAAGDIAGRLTADKIAFGIGVSTGSVYAGHLGSSTRFEYTAIGDTVNIAARIEELTREREHVILTTSATADAIETLCDDRALVAALEPAGTTTLRGRSHPTELCSLSPNYWRYSARSRVPEPGRDPIRG